MTAIELTAKVAEEAGIRKSAAGRIIEFVARSIIADLLLDGRSSYPGLGIFTVVTRAAKAFKNPQTGAPISKPAHKAVKFKPILALKNQIKG